MARLRLSMLAGSLLVIACPQALTAQNAAPTPEVLLEKYGFRGQVPGTQYSMVPGTQYSIAGFRGQGSGDTILNCWDSGDRGSGDTKLNC
jgi:hypothetical protein